MARWALQLRNGHAGVVAGLILSEQERLVDEVVQSIACDHALDIAAFEWRNGQYVGECFGEALTGLAPYLERGWLQWDGQVLRLRHEGQLLWRMIAACFRPQAALA